MKISVWGARVSHGIPVNDPCYSVNEGSFCDLLHTHRLLRSSRAAFHQPFITRQTQRQQPERSTKSEKKIAFLFFHSMKHLSKQTWQAEQRVSALKKSAHLPGYGVDQKQQLPEADMLLTRWQVLGDVPGLRRLTFLAAMYRVEKQAS